MTAKSGLFTTITYEGYYKLLQDASFHHDKALSEGSRRCQIKAHEVFTEPFQEIHDYHPSPQDDPQPTVKEDTLVETYEVHISNFKPKDNPSQMFIPEMLWKKFSSEDRKLITTKRYLPRLGHHLQVLPEPYQMPLGLQMVESQGPFTSDNPPNEDTSSQDQQLLAMVHETINMPLLTTHHLILTKFCPSTEPKQEHSRHPTYSPRPRPTFLSTN